MSSDTTRRQFLETLGSMPMVLGGLDEDDDGDILDDVLGLNNEGTTGPIAVGPAEDRTEIAPDQAELYIALDTGAKYTPSADQQQWEAIPSTGENPTLQSATIEGPAETQSFSTEHLDTVYSVRISSAGELDNLDSNISQGDVVRVEQPDTPYRTSSWIDIDTQDVTVVFESQWAANGNAIVKPSDGADVGGIRIGTGATTIEDVTVKNFGFNGNESTMTDTTKRLHGIIVDNAADVILDGGFLTKTHPYHEHNTGGSGITLTDSATGVLIDGYEIDDIGDRGVQMAGSRHRVRNCLIKNGFDRSIALDMDHPDGAFHAASDTVVVGNICGDNSQGSCIAVSGAPCDNCAVVANSCFGQFRGAVQFDNSKSQECVIAGNTAHRTGSDDSNQSAYVVPQFSLAVGNVIRDEAGTYPMSTGIKAVGAQSLISSNLIYLNDHGDGIDIREGDDILVANNLIRKYAGAAIIANGNMGYATIQNNHALNAVSTPSNFISIASGASPYILTDNHYSKNGNQPSTTYDLSTVPELAEGNWPPHHDLDTTVTVSGGGTTTQTVPSTSLGDDVDVDPTPANDPGNDHGYVVDKVWWDDSAGAIKVQVSETENAGGGDVRIVADRVGAY